MIGPKVVGMGTYPFRFSNEYLLDINSSFNYGYGVGLAMTYNVTDHVQVNIEGYYANKGRSLRGGFANQFKHNSRYSFIDFPVLFRYKWKREKYDIYVTGGGNLSYWLGGKGEIFSFEYDEAGIESFPYTIKRGTVTEIQPETMVLANANDILVGLDVGFGFIFPALRKKYFTVEVKYQHGHSWLGEDEGIDVGLIEYFEDYRSTISSLVIGLSFQFEKQIGEGKKGKTNFNRKRTINRKR